MTQKIFFLGIFLARGSKNLNFLVKTHICFICTFCHFKNILSQFCLYIRKIQFWISTERSVRRKKCWLQKLGEISHSRTQHSAQLGFRAFRFHLHKHMFYNLQNMETHSRTQHSNSNLACEVVFCLNFELLLELVIVFICTP